ncbi:MAG: hypothetical protein RL065_1415 [Bacteroidota bacterium]
MRKISADKVFTIENGIIENGVLILNEQNEIVSISTRDQFDSAELEILHGDICPGFINAHCHLELSHLKNKITPHNGLVNFIQQLIKARFEISMEERLQQIADAESEMIKNGIIAVGDISNEDISVHQKVKKNLYYHTFIETIGLNPSIAQIKFDEGLALSRKFFENELINSLCPHAPYSTSTTLQQLIYNLHQTSTIHSQESDEESKFFKYKSGDFIEFYKNINIDISFFNSTNKNSIQNNINFFPTSSKILFVHNTFMNENDLNTMMNHNSNSFLCACIKANLFIESKVPDIQLWSKYSNNICIGTDSLASNNCLSIWDEICSIQQYFPEITFNELLQYSTLNGARFLGIDNWAGSFKIGKKPGVNLIVEDKIKRIV